jgi:hypothetical protein
VLFSIKSAFNVLKSQLNSFTSDIPDIILCKMPVTNIDHR